MDDQIRKSELRRQARLRLGAQRERVRLLRRRAIVISVLAFVLLWGVVFAQMVSGNDPVLSQKKAKSKVKTVATTAPQPREEATESNLESEIGEIEAMEAEAAELESAELEVAEIEAAEVEAIEAEAVTTSPS